VVRNVSYYQQELVHQNAIGSTYHAHESHHHSASNSHGADA
jgi:hypothetical protein